MKNTSFSKWSQLGLGTGRLTSVGRGTTQEEVCRILSWMSTYGATVIDTADSYTSGRSEEMIGNALKVKRDQFVVVTKSGYRYGDLPAPMRRLNPFIKKFYQLSGSASCHTPSYLLRNLHRSLERLKTEYVDCFLLHDPTLEIVLSEEVQQHLLAAKEAGKVLHLGVSSGDKAVLEAAIEAEPYTVIQSPGNLSAVTSLKTVWQRAALSGMHIMANHVFYSGDIPEFAIPTHIRKHEYLMRSISQHFINGTILVGTKNENHFKECLNWLNSSE